MKRIQVDTLDKAGYVISSQWFDDINEALVFAYNTQGKKTIHW